MTASRRQAPRRGAVAAPSRSGCATCEPHVWGADVRMQARLDAPAVLRRGGVQWAFSAWWTVGQQCPRTLAGAASAHVRPLPGCWTLFLLCILTRLGCACGPSGNGILIVLEGDPAWRGIRHAHCVHWYSCLSLHPPAVHLTTALVTRMVCRQLVRRHALICCSSCMLL